MPGPLIVEALLGAAGQARLDALRRANYPPDRNHLHAHLTMFHGLAPSLEGELRLLLGRLAAGPPPPATLAGLIDLDGGVAFAVRSPALERLRGEIADHLHGMLSAQDRAGWRPHITIQNKVAPDVARILKRALERDFRPAPLIIAGLGLNLYRGGPWTRLGRFAFRSVAPPFS